MKSILKQCVGWLLSCVFGVIGGYAFTHWQIARLDQKVPALRSSRFELTDRTGRVVAVWGTDKWSNTVLAFLRKPGQDVHPEDYYLGPPPFPEHSPNVAFAIGMSSTQSPFMNLQATDGLSRVFLSLQDYQKPVFMMSDERYEGRLVLGFIDTDTPSPDDDAWGLSFRGPSVAGIGSFKSPVDGKYRGSLFVGRTPQSR